MMYCFSREGQLINFQWFLFNFSAPNSQADYVLSGSWSKKAISEASMLTQVQTIASSEDKSFTYAPHEDLWNISSDASYVHYCPNETIQGVAIHNAPEVNNP